MKTAVAASIGLVLVFAILSQAQNTASPGWGGAAWVWDQPDAHQVAQSNDPRYLRRTFTLPPKSLSADLWISADNQYVAYLNGHKIGTDSEWNTVEKYDVAKHLLPGKNVLALEARNQGGPAGIIARLHVKTADKKDVLIVTDQQTKITQGAAKDWTKTDFDDAGWFAAIVLGDSGIGPWSLGGGAGPAAKTGKGYDTNAVDAKIKTRLTPQEQLKHFVVPEGFEVELVVADPLVINPITMTLDDQGRMIVSESHTYRYGPSGSPIKPYANPVVRLDPDGKGGFRRTLVADGFADPVMGIAVKGDKLWLTANNYLYMYDYPRSPLAGDLQVKGNAPIALNKKTIVTDLNKAWNPFGMFVLEWGPDGKLYMSVGNHAINMHGPDKDKMSGRGSSGIIVRMNPDGSKMERLVHGLRVPYSFDYDPFGQLWLLSNGEGNPNRFVRVIDGVDYHCYSRGTVDNNWLAGNHPLAPPCEELHRGADTQLMRYYAAAYPARYQGNLFLCNWGAHGFAGPNRGIFRFVPDDRGNIILKEPLLSCTDPHFRPAHIALDSDGNLLVADWYGRDDESDMTGRIWRLKYKGTDRLVVKHRLDAPEWKDDDYAIRALGSPHHLIREKATNELIKRPQMEAVGKLGEYARTTKEPLGAAAALWALLRIDTKESKWCLSNCLSNEDWKVRRLVVNLMRRHQMPLSVDAVGFLSRDKDPGVRVEAALALKASGDTRDELMVALITGAAADIHLRYEAAWHLAKHADEQSITKLLTCPGDDAAAADVRLAGLIAIDVACYENFPSKKAALEALARALENPGKLDHQLLLMVAQLGGDASIVPSLEKLIARNDLPTATIAKAVLVLKTKTGGSLAQSKLSAAAGKRLIEAVEKGSLRIASPTDQLVIFEFLESEGPTPFALKQIDGQLRSNQPALKQAAHTLARRFGPMAAPLAAPLWPSVLDPKTKFEDAIEYLSTIARAEAVTTNDTWTKLLDHGDPLVRMEAVRWWRRFQSEQVMVDALAQRREALIKNDENVRADMESVLAHLDVKSPALGVAKMDKDALTKYAHKELADMKAADRAKRAAMGLQVFERNACTKCHTTATQTTLLAPSLKGIAAQKIDYLIESMLYPSKIIKTGFESETVTTTGGKVLTGLVKDEGNTLRVLNQDKDVRVPKTEVESRTLSRISIMPEGQEAQLSRREFVDLIAFLATLK